MKQISEAQIQQVLSTVLSTNISWQNGEAMRQFFAKLPDVPKIETTAKTEAPKK